MRFFALTVAAFSLFTHSNAPCGSDAGTREQIARQEHHFQAFVQNQMNAGNDTLTKTIGNYEYVFIVH
jgi:hypothetical protein